MPRRRKVYLDTGLMMGMNEADKQQFLLQVYYIAKLGIGLDLQYGQFRWTGRGWKRAKGNSLKAVLKPYG